MKYRYAFAIALAAITTSACSKSAEVKPEQIFATVNGEVITNKEFETLVNIMSNGSVTADKLTPEQRKMVTDRLIMIHVTAAQAQKEGLDKQEETALQLKLMRNNVLSSAAIKQYMEKIVPTDAEIKAEYDAKMGNAPREYKASHILVKTEDEANALIAKLNKGADFADLAKKNSTDPGSGKNGGDLGWFPGTQMVPEFTAALQTLEKGKITQKPVKSQFGYHVIKLEDVRDGTPPPLADVKPQIENSLKQQKVEKYIEGLRNSAKVDIKSAASSSSSSVSSATK